MGVKEFVDVSRLQIVSPNPSDLSVSLYRVWQNEIETNTVAIFSKSTCPYCAATKKLFATEFPDVKTQIFECVPIPSFSGFGC